MTSKKQSKAYERKRHEQHQRKIAAAKAQQQRRRKTTALVVAGTLVVAIVVLVIVTVTSSRNSPSASSSASTAPASSPSADAAQSADATPSATAAAGDAVETEGWANSLTPPDPSLALDKVWTVQLDTNQGPITLELDGVNAPQSVASFVSLAQEGFFDGTDCHRLTTDGIYVLQCGDPTGTGRGGPAYHYGPLENTPDDDSYPAGTLAMARQGNNAESMGSQFFIVYKDSNIPSDTAGGYTVFGEVTQGLAIVGDVAQAGTITGGSDGRPAQSVIINEVSVS